MIAALAAGLAAASTALSRGLFGQHLPAERIHAQHLAHAGRARQRQQVTTRGLTAIEPLAAAPSSKSGGAPGAIFLYAACKKEIRHCSQPEEVVAARRRDK
jgi:hypothetical protein